MNRKYIYANGQPIPQGHCVVPDHSVQTFTVTIRSLRTLSPETIKNLIEKKFEVLDCEETAGTIVGGSRPN